LSFCRAKPLLPEESALWQQQLLLRVSAAQTTLAAENSLAECAREHAVEMLAEQKGLPWPEALNRWSKRVQAPQRKWRGNQRNR
jgi:hypothetical protein